MSARVPAAAYGRLLAIAAHDLRSPLGAIVGALDLLDEDANEDTRSLVRVLRRSTQALTRLAADMSALGGSRGDVVPAETPLADVVRSALARVTELATARGVALEADLEELVAVVDVTVFGHLCDILLDDAIAASLRNATIRVRLRRDGAAPLLVVEGEGPPPDDAAAYFVTPRTRARGGRGSGIAPVAAGVLADLLAVSLSAEPASASGGVRFLVRL
ncbi:MAG: HAMP domain-containing histidine kinase [Myxococcales bacterium]|nr:HAMP domain-containing histidine kinase [Myxococcales bacterium]